MGNWLIVGAVSIVVLWFAGCSACTSSSPPPGPSKKDLGKCDISLECCVSILGNSFKDKCYETYNACVLGGENKTH